MSLRREMQLERSNSVISNEITRRSLWELLGTACIFLFAPLIVITLLLLYVYRCLVKIVLRIQLRNKFAGLLKGTDCVWAVEDAVSLSVINILMILEKTAGNSNTVFLEDLRNLINNRIVSKAAGTTLEKLFYLRNQKFGYYFWERTEEVDLKDRIRWLECVDANCDGSCEDISGESFKKTLENVFNKPLPDDNRATWEILVGKRCPKSKSHVEEDHLFLEDCFNTNTRKIPVVFRVHHSLGDGVALLDLLLKTIAEERDHFRGSLKFSNNVTIKSLKQQAKISINRIWLNFKNITLKQMYGRFKEVTRFTMILLSSPRFLIQHAIRSMDENALHGPPQTGEKIISYWLENDETNNKSQNLLTKIRVIKKNTSAKFNDIVLAAFSASVHKYYLCINKPVPDALTIICPIRLSMPKNLTLDNEFSVAILRICIGNANGQTIVEPNRDSQFFKRLQDITRTNNEVRKSSDIMLNFWIMKYLSALLPVKILRAFLLTRSTMGFSNICGPEKVRILNNSLSNIAFWIPNKSTTALGFSLLSYGGNLHLSLMADKSIIKDERSFMELLENTVHEIDTAFKAVRSSNRNTYEKRHWRVSTKEYE
ncbi:uncharacterized protein LOC143899254 isoform X2 [Temnothorax americanus]|uniref:uncharacterized protein LOC143899254 isoform X2 n=1 Tax=Temnothorax americanus TaxID=1964332 RepID=UPI00406814A1